MDTLTCSRSLWAFCRRTRVIVRSVPAEFYKCWTKRLKSWWTKRSSCLRAEFVPYPLTTQTTHQSRTIGAGHHGCRSTTWCCGRARSTIGTLRRQLKEIRCGSCTGCCGRSWSGLWRKTTRNQGTCSRTTSRERETEGTRFTGGPV